MFEIKPKLVDKKIVSSLYFPNCAIDHVPETKEYIDDICKNAPELSSEGGAEFKIIFSGLSDLLEVHSQVFDTCEEEIVLNNGVSIPKNRVVDIKFNRLL